MKHVPLFFCFLLCFLCCIVSATVPVADFTAGYISNNPTDISFTDTTTGNPTNWNWSFGDGTFSDIQNPYHQYAGGQYTVILTALNSDGYDTISHDFTFNYPEETPVPTQTTTLDDVPKSNEESAPLSVSKSSSISTSIIIPGSQTARIGVESSEKYLQWSFVSVDISQHLPLLDIYLDDSATPVITNYTLGTYLHSGLTSGERHTITLYNSTARLINASEPELIGKATAKTTTADWSLYFLVCVGFLILILLIILNELVMLILLGIFAIAIDLIGMGISGSYAFISSIFLGLAIISGIILLIKALPKLKDAISWL